MQKRQRQAAPSPANTKMTRSAAHKARLKALLESVRALRADYSELQTFHSMSLEATTEAAVSVLMSDYKEGSESILRTTALAMSPSPETSHQRTALRRLGVNPSTIKSLERFQQVRVVPWTLQVFVERDTRELLSSTGARLFAHAEELDMVANTALQALLLVSTR